MCYMAGLLSLKGNKKQINILDSTSVSKSQVKLHNKQVNIVPIQVYCIQIHSLENGNDNFSTLFKIFIIIFKLADYAQYHI